MKHRISAGTVLVEENRVLLVRHQKKNSYDFWVLPGGGVIDGEDILTAAIREAKEETGLTLQCIRPIYLEEFLDASTHHMKTWILCRRLHGDIATTHPAAKTEGIITAKFFSQDDVTKTDIPIFPDIMHHQFWEDLNNGFPHFQYLGIREMTFQNV